MFNARRTSLAVAVLLAVLVAVPQQALAEDQAPFRATVAETFTAVPCGPSLCITITGTGHASHIGKFTESAFVVSDLAHPISPNCFPETRTTTFTAANGDQIKMDATGQNCATGTTLTALDHYVVTGGTGRFSDATGRGTIKVTADLVTKTGVVTFAGVLSTDDSVQ